MIRQGDTGRAATTRLRTAELAISRDGTLVGIVSRGDGFGEIALVRDIPRQATVTAVTDVSLYALRKDLFVQTVTGHVGASAAARAIVAGHMGDPNGHSVADELLRHWSQPAKVVIRAARSQNLQP